MSSLIYLFNACLITSTGRRGCRGETNSRTPLFASLFSQLMMSTWTWWPSTSWLILCEGSLSANLTTSKWLLTLWLLGVLIICRFTTSMLSTRSFGTATVYELPSASVFTSCVTDERVDCTTIVSRVVPIFDKCLDMHSGPGHPPNGWHISHGVFHCSTGIYIYYIDGTH